MTKILAQFTKIRNEREYIITDRNNCEGILKAKVYHQII